MRRSRWAALAAAAISMVAPETARSWDVPPAASGDVPPAMSAEPVDLAAVARRVVDRRCVSCHSDGGPAAKLSLETHASVLRGGKTGPVIVAGRPEESALVRRMTLPLGDKRHMPPPSEEQPIAAELEALRMWIAAGGTETALVPRESLNASALATLDAALDPPAKGAAPIVTVPEPPRLTTSRAPRAAPHHATTSAGCASCAVGAAPATRMLPRWLAAAGIVLALMWRRKRHSRSGGAHAATAPPTLG